MILSALANLYERLLSEDADSVPSPGWNRRPVPFGLVLRPDGSVAQLADLRDKTGKKPVAPSLLVPDHGEARTSAAKTQPYFLCDHTAFLLGARDGMGDKALEYLAYSRALHERLLAGCDDPFAVAIRAFFATWTPARAPELAREAGLDWVKEVSGANLAFLHKELPGRAHESETLKRLWNAEFDRRAAAPEGQCLVTGTVQPIARLHPGIKLAGTTGNGAPVVSFNADAFTSYGHDQGLNAPVGQRTAFAYAAALNLLVGRDSPRKLSFGDTTVVFWAEAAATDEEIAAAALFGSAIPAIDESVSGRVRAILESLRRGLTPRDALAGLRPDLRFFVLGLGAPGGSRVAVRFWHVCTFGELAARVAAHHEAVAIEPRSDKEKPFPTLHTLLRAVVPQGKDENIPGPLAAALAQAVLTGGPYPPTLLALALQRMRVEHGPYDSVSSVRAGLVKACLTRCRTDWEPSMSLNPDDTDTAYRLGRLFAALERAQQLALGTGINATIKDRYFGAASSSPRAVFPNLVRLAQHHLSKAGAGWLDKLIGDILDAVPTSFPATLDLEAQGRFALGYYHQRNDLWRSKKTADTQTEDTES